MLQGLLDSAQAVIQGFSSSVKLIPSNLRVDDGLLMAPSAASSTARICFRHCIRTLDNVQTFADERFCSAQAQLTQDQCKISMLNFGPATRGVALSIGMPCDKRSM